MSEKSKKFYITTSIIYTNAIPHIGFALEILQADVLARYHRELGEDVFFLTGTDEHVSKIAKKAKEQNKSPEEFTDEITKRVKELTEKINLSNDDFIRTTDRKRHWPSVKKVWENLYKKGDIYKKKYQGYYCMGCEAFLTESDLVEFKCPDHQKKPDFVEEENYFFRLSKYSSQIRELIEKDEIKIIPETKRREVLDFIKKGLEDVSFSRSSEKLKWGIPVPGDESQTIYVWVDALTNYISTLDYAEKGERFNKYWPADVHIIGKDIQRFHSAIWPGILLSLEIPLPKKIFIHGHITSDGQKMSKSLGNVIDPLELINKYGSEAVRYYLLREIPSFKDGDFSFKKFEERYNADLASGLGNLLSRTITLAEKTKSSATGMEIKEEFSKIKKRYEKSLNDFKFNEALISVWDFISFCDKYIEKEKPWETGDKNVIGNLLFALKEISQLLKPFLPESSQKIAQQLKTLKKEPLFPRIKA